MKKLQTVPLKIRVLQLAVHIYPNDASISVCIKHFHSSLIGFLYKNIFIPYRPW